MRTILISAVLVLSACAYAEEAPWFVGIGENVTETNDMKSTNAAWAFPSTDGAVAIENGKLVLDLDDADTVTLTPVASAAPDTNTVVKLSINTTIASVDALPDVSEMSDAQTALAICGGSFMAWDGAAWQTLAAATEADGAVDLSVCLSYQDMKASDPVRTATFWVGTTKIGEVTLTGAAQAKNALSSIVCKGSATIASIDGDVTLGVAKNDETKYGTIADAVQHASTVSDKSVVLLRDTTEVVKDPPAGITIDFNGKKIFIGNAFVPFNYDMVLHFISSNVYFSIIRAAV